MSKKMNYGKRFGSATCGGAVGYNPDLGRDPFKIAMAQMSPLKKALLTGQAQGNSKASKKRVGKLPTGDAKVKVKSREEYEQEFGMLITDVVHRLEAGLEELNKAPPLAKNNQPSLIKRKTVIEAIQRLKHSFFAPHYFKRTK